MIIKKYLQFINESDDSLGTVDISFNKSWNLGYWRFKKVCSTKYN